MSEVFTSPECSTALLQASPSDLRLLPCGTVTYVQNNSLPTYNLDITTTLLLPWCREIFALSSGIRFETVFEAGHVRIDKM